MSSAEFSLGRCGAVRRVARDSAPSTPLGGDGDAEMSEAGGADSAAGGAAAAEGEIPSIQPDVLLSGYVEIAGHSAARPGFHSTAGALLTGTRPRL